jgi:hypothetical protein
MDATPRSSRGIPVAIALIGVFAMMHPPVSEGLQIIQGNDVKVTLDNHNVDAGFATPSFDARNMQQNETSVAVSPVDHDIVAIGSNDLRLFDFFAPVPTTSNIIGVNVSIDAGATWFNTQIPGFPADTSPAGLASPLEGMQGSSDPTVRFDSEGNLYVSAIAFVAIAFVPGVTPVPDNLVFVAKYRYTPGTPAGVSTPHSAGNPPDFTYEFTTIVERGALSLLPDPAFFQTFNFPGQFEDKTWMGVDTNSSSPCVGSIYVAWTMFTGNQGARQIVFSRSTDGGASFSQPVPVSQRGQEGNQAAQGAYIAIGSDGRVYVAYRAFATNPSDVPSGIDVVRSSDCGVHFGKPVSAVPSFVAMRGVEPGLTFRTPTFPWLAVDDTNPYTIYLAYTAKTGSPSNADIFVVRSTDAGDTWGNPVKVNDDSTSKHQFFPTIDVSHGVLHVAWYDLRDSSNPMNPATTNDVLNVYYAASNTAGQPYPAFSGNVKVSDVGQQPNCFFGSAGFMGDYIGLAAYFDGTVHNVHVAWADNRDIPVEKCDLDPAPGPTDRFTGQRNQNVYTDRILVMP